MCDSGVFIEVECFDINDSKCLLLLIDLSLLMSDIPHVNTLTCV